MRNKEIPFRMGLQLFASRPDYKEQSDKSLQKSIASLTERVAEHRDKFEHPERYVNFWSEADERYKAGLLKHWEKEIFDFEAHISEMSKELKRRSHSDD